MATQTQFAGQYDILKTMVKTWDRRLRTQQSVAWLARAMIPGLLIGIGVSVAARLRPLISQDEVGLLSVVSLIISLGMMLGWVWLRPRPPLQAAQHFDVDFGLQERISTALELLNGRIHTTPEFATHQLEDALVQAQHINAHEKLPLQSQARDWIIVGVLSVLWVALILIPNPVAQGLQQNAAQQAAIASAAEAVREAIEEVASDTALADEEREQLLESLEASLETLEDEALTEEEALATIYDVEELLNEQAAQLEEENELQQNALDAATEALDQNPANQQGVENTQGGEATGDQNFNEVLENLSENLDRLSEAQQNELADQLRDAADTLEATLPDLAEQLRGAAESADNGERPGVQEALQQAQETLSDLQDQQQQNSDTAHELQQQSQQMQQQQRQLGAELQNEGQQSQQGQPQEGQQGQQSSDEQPGQPSDMQEGEDGEGGQPSEGEGGQPGAIEGGQEGNAREGQQRGASQAGQQPSDQVGEQPGDLGQDTAGFEETGERPQGGGEATGERAYEEVFVPSAPEDTGDDQIRLETDAGDEPLQQGDFSENPEGQVTVPYNQVFSDYANSVTEALDQDYVPLGLRDVVREYFTSLAPRGEENGN